MQGGCLFWRRRTRHVHPQVRLTPLPVQPSVHPSQLGTVVALLRSWQQGQVVNSCCLSDICWNVGSSCFSASSHEEEGRCTESLRVACRVAAAFADSHSAAGASGAAKPAAAAAAQPGMPGAGTEQQGGAKGLLLLVPLMLGLHGKVKLARTGWSRACTYWLEQSMHMPSCHNMAAVC